MLFEGICRSKVHFHRARNFSLVGDWNGDERLDSALSAHTFIETRISVDFRTIENRSVIKTGSRQRAIGLDPGARQRVGASAGSSINQLIAFSQTNRSSTGACDSPRLLCDQVHGFL